MLTLHALLRCMPLDFSVSLRVNGCPFPLFSSPSHPSFLKVLDVYLGALALAEVELVRAAVAALRHLHTTRHLFSRELFSRAHAPRFLGALLRALLEGHCDLLRDDLLTLFHDILLHVNTPLASFRSARDAVAWLWATFMPQYLGTLSPPFGPLISQFFTQQFAAGAYGSPTDPSPELQTMQRNLVAFINDFRYLQDRQQADSVNR